MATGVVSFVLHCDSEQWSRSAPVSAGCERHADVVKRAASDAAIWVAVLMRFWRRRGRVLRPLSSELLLRRSAGWVTATGQCAPSATDRATEPKREPI